MALRSNDFGRATGLVSEAAALAVAAAFFFAFLGPACGKAKAVRSKTMNRDFLKDIVASEMGCEKKTEHSMPLLKRCKLRFEIFIRQYREGSTKVISPHYFLYCLSDGIATLLAQIHSIQKEAASRYAPMPTAHGQNATATSQSGNGMENLVVRSESLKRVMKLAEKVARHPAAVLVARETGTGKEMIAHHIHNCSLRSHGPLIDVNCAAIP